MSKTLDNKTTTNNEKTNNESKTVYLFAFRCKACNAPLNHSGTASVKEYLVGDTRYLEENNYCSKCVSGSREANYEPEYAHAHLCETSDFSFNSSFSDDY